MVGQLVVLPGLESQHGLIDANLLTRAVAPVHLRCVELALVSSVLLVGLTPHWLRSRLATTLALLAVASTGILRMVALPSVYEAWARVDRVAQAPYDRLVRAEGFESLEVDRYRSPGLRAVAGRRVVADEPR